MSVKVTIYGTEYPVKGDADPEYIRSVAAYLDGKMREVGKSLSVKSTTKVAVLAALNITDELMRSREGTLEQSEVLSDRIALLADAVKDVLAEE